MRKILFSIAACVVIFCSCDNADKFRLKFSPENLETKSDFWTALLEVEKPNIYLGQIEGFGAEGCKIIDSVQVRGTNFSFEGAVPEDSAAIYYLFTKNKYSNEEYIPLGFFVPEKGTIHINRLMIEGGSSLKGTPKNERKHKHTFRQSHILANTLGGDTV